MMEKDSTCMRSISRLLIMLITTNKICKRICLQIEMAIIKKMNLVNLTQTTKMNRIRMRKTPFKNRLPESSKYVRKTGGNLEMLSSQQTTPLSTRILLTHLIMLKTCLCLNGEDQERLLRIQSWSRMEQLLVTWSKEYWEIAGCLGLSWFYQLIQNYYRIWLSMMVWSTVLLSSSSSRMASGNMSLWIPEFLTIPPLRHLFMDIVQILTSFGFL